MPEHDNTYDELLVTVSCSAPDVAFVPDHDPEAVQDVAFCDAQVSVTCEPDTTVEADAEIVTVGAGTTVTAVDA